MTDAGKDPAAAAPIALLSPCGHGNLGDAAILESVIHGIRRRRPEARILAFTLNAPDTAARHGVEAYPCSGVSPRYYGASQAQAGPARSEPTERREPRGGALRAVLKGLPGARAIYALATTVRSEIRLLKATWRMLRQAAFVVVAGGGQLDEFWGGPFSHPYTLYRWSRLARGHDARFVVLSVGTGTLRSWTGQAFVGAALARAHYRSFRDPQSRELARGLYAPAEADPVVPDLAYAVPLPPAPPPKAAGRPIEVGIAPIAEGDPRLWPTPDPARYARHLAGLAAFARDILASGATVRLFATDGPDHAAASRLHELILQESPAAGRLVLEPTRTLPALLGLLEEVDLVVAARLHAVLLAHVQGRPALALSYERKVATLMKEVGHEEFCLPIEDFEPGRAKELLDRLTLRRDELSRGLRADAGRRRELVEEQYDRVFGPRGGTQATDGRG